MLSNWLIPIAKAQDIKLLPGEGQLAERIKSGEIQLSDIATFIAYFIQIGIMVAGIISFLMLLVGGYQYIIGGVYSEMQQQGKTTLFYAITGLVISLLAYGIVNLIQLAATSL